MQIRVGYGLIYDCPQPVPMILTLNIHYTRVSDTVVPDHLITNPSVPITAYRDGFGNWCSRIVGPTGQIRLSANGDRERYGRAGCGRPLDPTDPGARAVRGDPGVPVGQPILRIDRLSEVAWGLFGNSPPGWARVQAICDFVHNHIVFGYEHARSTKTAWDVFNRLGAWQSCDTDLGDCALLLKCVEFCSVF